ncbi:MAG: hypothetical protein B6I28_00635 [Fusobacteriia bacterium 4572_132]|nr:MAG: hypothetical protein B6I28_00635 [Fusobacteriia bacterium 4572_132]
MIKTFHNLLIEDKKRKYKEKIYNYVTLSEELSSEILRVNPNLVSEVSAGTVKREILEKEIIKLIDKKGINIDRDIVIKEVFSYMFGYGILQKYVEDEEITDIDGSRYNYFTIKKDGKKYKADISFGSEEEFDKFCKLIIIRNGGIINENDSHSRISDENYRLRINVSIKPRNITGTSINIRKHKRKSYTLNELKNLKMIDQDAQKLLEKFAKSNKRIIFSGKGAAGKTTLLRAYIKNIDKMERILFCESDAEIYPESENFISQKIKKESFGGKRVTLKDLINDGLTMSLDGYCVGELIGEETWDFLKAGYTDHKILATIHAISAKDTLYRLLMLVENTVSGLSEKTIKRIIANSIDIIVYLKEFKVKEIIKINGYIVEKDEFDITYLLKC